MAIYNGKKVFFSPKVIVDGYDKGFDDGYAAGEEQWKTYWLNTGDHFDLPEGMVEIPERMFYEHTSLAVIAVPETVEKIGPYAFMGCTGLIAYPMNDNVTDIGEYAFNGCRSLIDVKLPPKLETINAGIFAGCSNVKFKGFPKGISMVGHYAFNGCTSNNTASIPAEVKSVGNLAFGNNYGITEITFFGKPVSIAHSTDRMAFKGCYNLKRINVPWSEGEVAGAPWGAPDTCEIVYNWMDITDENYTFPSGLIYIPEAVCQGNTNIKEVTIGDEVFAIDDYAFNNCTNLSKVNLPNGLIFIGKMAFKGSKVVVTELPETVNEIEDQAFANGRAALSKLPPNLWKLETYCFSGCGGNTFKEIPASCICISSGALWNNTGLTELTIHKNDDLHIDENVFKGCTNLTDIYVDWAEGQVANAPWGAPNATIHYNYKGA